jgi:hypothetical protein
LAFLDDDDEWFRQKIEKQVKALRDAGVGTAGVQCGWTFYENGVPRFVHIPDVNRDHSRALLERPCMAPSSLLLSKSVFLEFGGFDPSLRRMEDWDLWIRIATRYDFHLIEDVLLDRRAHPKQLLARDEWEARWQIFDRVRPQIDALSPVERRRALSVHEVAFARYSAEMGKWGSAARWLTKALVNHPLSLEIRDAVKWPLIQRAPAWLDRALTRRRLRRPTRRAVFGVEVKSW